jgi:glycosyltransferase involved in cell wall biosynthesis
MVSVIIPCWNAGPLLEDAIDSCLGSVFADLEIIVVNCGSTDPYTHQLLNNLNKPNTRVIHLGYQGYPFARNAGIREARGKYVMSLNVDHSLHPDYIGRAVQVMEERPEIGFVSPSLVSYGPAFYIWEAPKYHLGRMLTENISCTTSLIRKSAWNEVGGYDENLSDGYEDWNFWLSLAAKGWNGGTLPNAFCYYRASVYSHTQEVNKHESYRTYIYNKHLKKYPQSQLYELLYAWLQDEIAARDKMRSVLGNDFRMDPIVSVVIPCYNYGKFVEETIDSCLHSTFQDIEIIVVDNGSTDPYTIKVLNQLNKPKTRVLRNNNNNLPNGRNVGIRQAKGKYILPVDADDLIAPTMIEKMYRVLESKPEVGFVTGGLHYFGDQYWDWLPPPFDLKGLLRSNTVCVTSLFRKKAWSDVGGYNESMTGYADWDFWISLAEKGWVGDSIPEILLYYRRHGSNMSTESGKKHNLLANQIRTNHPKLYPNG